MTDEQYQRLFEMVIHNHKLLWAVIVVGGVLALAWIAREIAGLLYSRQRIEAQKAALTRGSRIGILQALGRFP